jgi:signal transduction histidine kinase
MKVLWLYCLLLCIGINHARAQKNHRFLSRHYTVENGLPSNGIKGIEWDESTGFLWIATEAGIVRFDGINLKIFTKQNKPIIKSERMSFITRSFDSGIYIADLYKNIFKVNKNDISLAQKADANHATGSYTITVSEKFFLKRQQLENELLLLDLNSNIVPISDTACFIKNKTDLLFLSVSMKEPSLLRRNVETLFKVADEYFLLDDAGFVFNIQYIDRYSEKRERLVKEDLKDLAISDNDNLLWQAGMASPLIVEGNNIWKLKRQGKQLVAELLMNNFSNNALIRSAQYSAVYNILFIASDSKGLTVYFPEKVTSRKVNSINTSNHNAYYSQIDLLNGNILTNEGDIIGDSKAVTPIKLAGKFNFATYAMGDSLIWYSQSSAPLNPDHLKCYNKYTGQIRSYPKVRGVQAMTSVGNQLYIIDGAGLYNLEKDSLRLVYNFGNKTNLYFQMLERQPGVISIASCEGLYEYNTLTSKFSAVYVDSGTCVRSLWSYGDYLFFGSYGNGVFVMKNGVVKKMPLDKNHFLLYTHCFVPDGDGFVLMSTNRGLFKANIQQLLHAFDDSSSNVYYYYLGQNDGMQTTEMNGGCTPCALQMNNRIISFPTMDGLLWVDPKAITGDFSKGNIYLDEFEVNGKLSEQLPDDKLKLPSNTREIKIRLAVSSWLNKENIYIDYNINGAGKWIPIDVDKAPEIILNNLPPGEYIIRIRKLNGFELNSFTYKEIKFSISTPWYYRWWAILTALIGAFLLVALLVRIRTTQYRINQAKLEKQVGEKTKELKHQNELLEKSNVIKTRLISIISHDIVTPLKFVTAASLKLVGNRKQMPESLQNETITEIANTSQELQLLCTNILNWIKYQNESRLMAKEPFEVHNVINQVMSILQTLAKQKDLQLVNDIDPQLKLHQYFEPLKILVYNLVTNAINFSSNGQIIISSLKRDHSIVITVADNGSGMAAEQVQNILEDRFVNSSVNIDNRKGHGLGYLIIKDLLKMMQASIEIESEPGRGTIVNIVMPDAEVV